MYDWATWRMYHRITSARRARAAVVPVGVEDTDEKDAESHRSLQDSVSKHHPQQQQQQPEPSEAQHHNPEQSFSNNNNGNENYNLPVNNFLTIRQDGVEIVPAMVEESEADSDPTETSDDPLDCAVFELDF